MTLNNAIALDGGLVDNVPVDFLYPGEPEKPTLVLLTRTYPKKQIPRKAHRTYIQPSRKIPVKRWDYTNPEGVRKTFELGKTDGERFLKKMK
jgi:predicted patatin/cPLA2 family phospholipase